MSRFEHGHNGPIESPTHSSWRGMIQRCTNPNHRKYIFYGGRGIKVCDRWRRFVNFLEDMGERPSREFQLDRKNNDVDYCKENCRWVPKWFQNLNRRNVSKTLINYDASYSVEDRATLASDLSATGIL